MDLLEASSRPDLTWSNQKNKLHQAGSCRTLLLEHLSRVPQNQCSSYNLWSMSQGQTETKREFRTKGNREIARGDYVYPLQEVRTLYIDILHTKIRKVVARHRGTHRHATYLDLLYFDQQDVDQVHAGKIAVQPGQMEKLL